METGPCSGWCAFTDGKVDCSNAEAGDCKPNVGGMSLATSHRRVKAGSAYVP